MNIIHALVSLEDTFSGCKTQKITTVSEITFNKMKQGIGTTFKQFDKKTQISYTWQVLDVRQALPSDYSNF